MSTPLITSLLWFVAGGALTTVAWRMARLLRQSTPIPRIHPDWPLAMRPFLGVARPISDLIQDKLPAWCSERVARRLRRADLDSAVTPELWTGLCLGMALPAGILSGVVAAAMQIQIVTAGFIAMMLTWVLCERWIRQRSAALERRVIRDLPSCLDLLTLCVEAGATLTAAARYIVDHSPEGPLRRYFDRVLREIRSGRARAQAFVGVADSLGIESLCSLASALSHAEASGMSVGQVLRTQAEQRSSERFVRAERQAMQAPVKMLAPLIFCIFPCTFIVLALPIAWRVREVFQS